MKADILAVGAHPDDLELSIGGTLALMSNQGSNIVLVDLTQGELGTRGTKEIRMREADEATKILNAKQRINLMIPDGNIEVHQPNIKKLITVIRQFQPAIMFIPHSTERHPDHVHAHTLAKEAWFYAGLEKIQTSYHGEAQEPWRPDAYFHFMQRHEFTPSFIVDISSTMETKMAAIRAHASQFYNPTSKERETLLSRPKFLDHIINRAQYYGEMIGVHFGEPFFSPVPIGVTNISNLIYHKK